MSKSRDEWFKEADLSDELSQKRAAAGGFEGGGGAQPPEGVGTPPKVHQSPFAVGEFALGKDEEGKPVLPPRIRQVPVIRFSERPEPEPREYVVEGLVPEAAATSARGDGDVAKSMMAMSLGVHLAMGKEVWMGRKIEPCSVVYCDFELTADEQHRRAAALSRGIAYEDKIPDELVYMSALGYTSEEAFSTAYQAAYETAANLLVVDSVGLALQGEAESATEVISWYRRIIDPFVREGMAVLLIDHQSKGGDSYQRRTSFGSVYKRNLVRSEIQIEALDQDEGRGTLDLVFRQSKHNFGAKARPFGAQVVFRDGEIRTNVLDLSPQRLATEEGTKATDRVRLAMSYMEGPLTAQSLADETNMSPKTVQNAISQLKASGELRGTGKKVGRFEVLEGGVRQSSVVRYGEGGGEF